MCRPARLPVHSPLGSAGYDPRYGARPLKRAVQTHLLNPLASAMLSGSVAEGDTVFAHLEDDKLVIRSNHRSLDGSEVVPAAESAA